jgi:MFS family permease
MVRRQGGIGLLVDPSLNSEAGAMAEAIPLARSDRLLATIALMVATGMQAADATIANVALPQLEHDLGGGLVLGAWVMTSYLCANALAAPLTGWLRRRFGARRLFAVGTGVFVAASLLCSLSPTPTAIILSRIAQGAGGGIIHPLAQAILLDLYPKRQHGRMLGIWGAVIMVGPIFGPALGASSPTWRPGAGCLPSIFRSAHWRSGACTASCQRPNAALTWQSTSSASRFSLLRSARCNCGSHAGWPKTGSIHPSSWRRRRSRLSPSPPSQYG